MQNILELFLGILSAMGGFVDIGEVVFTLDGGGLFGYSLLWINLLGTAGIIVFCEMVGRIAAVTHLSIFDVVRQHVGVYAGLGGVAMMLQLLIGWRYRLLIVVALALLLASSWLLRFEWIERTFGLLGLFMLVFLFSAISLKPDWSQFAAGC